MDDLENRLSSLSGINRKLISKNQLLKIDDAIGGRMTKERINIILVDDRPENLMALSATLEDLDIDIVCAESGMQALKIVREQEFALVLMDVQMPEMNGFETASLIRSREKTRALPIIFVTAISKEQKYIFKGYESGAVDYLFKPLDPTIVTSKVKVFIELARQKNQIKTDAELRRRVDAKIQATQRIESLSVLACGVAHNFNNMLVGVIGNLDMAVFSLAENAPQRRQLEQASDTAQKMALLAEQMLNYSGKVSFVRQDLSINDVIEAQLQLLTANANPEISVALNIKEPLSLIKGDPDQLTQLLSNLFLNAFEAIGDLGGQIDVSTDNINFVEKEESPEGENLGEISVGQYVKLEISDTGSGIEEDIIRKIFDPFFSTKFTGRGLGLAASLGIVHAHNAAIRVKSSPGKGTLFQVCFPVVS
jgi:signal transduction histidine kinase